MQYEYKMVQMPPTIAVQSNNVRGQEAALYLESVVNDWSSRGWEFFRVDTLGVLTQPGCLLSLLGFKAQHTDYFVVTMRRLR